MTPEELKLSIFKKAFSGKLVDQKIDDIPFNNRKSKNNIEPPFEVPFSWSWATLGECAEIYTGNSISETVKTTKYTGRADGLDYIGTKDVNFNNTVNYDNGVKIPFNEDFRHAETGSILLCIEGGSAGRKIAIIDRTVCFGNKLCHFYSQTVLNKYIYYYLQSSNFKSIFNNHISGIIGGVSIKKIKSILMPLPPLEEQKRIVAKIEELLPLVDKYEEAWTKLEKFNNQFPIDMEKSILQYALEGKLTIQDIKNENANFIIGKISNKRDELIKNKILKKDKRLDLTLILKDKQPYEIPKNWIWVNFGSLLFKLTDGTHSTPKYITSGIKFVSVKDMSQGRLNLTDTKFISKEEHELLFQRCNPEKGDILLSKVGTTGVPAIVDTDEQFSLFVSVALLKFDDSLLDRKFLYYLIKSPVVQKQADLNTRGVANKNWVLDDIANTIVPLPPLEEQKRIVAKIEELLPLCRSLK